MAMTVLISNGCSSLGVSSGIALAKLALHEFKAAWPFLTKADATEASVVAS
jgi:hypothetical protein